MAGLPRPAKALEGCDVTETVFLSAFAMVCSVPVVITALVVGSRYATQRRATASALEQAELLRRLERLQEAVDTSAIEIERLSEANRYVARFLTEKTGKT
jgi:sensor domain CHASE-containing protein